MTREILRLLWKHLSCFVVVGFERGRGFFVGFLQVGLSVSTESESRRKDVPVNDVVDAAVTAAEGVVVVVNAAGSYDLFGPHPVVVKPVDYCLRPDVEFPGQPFYGHLRRVRVQLVSLPQLCLLFLREEKPRSFLFLLFFFDRLFFLSFDSLLGEQ